MTESAFKTRTAYLSPNCATLLPYHIELFNLYIRYMIIDTINEKMNTLPHLHVRTCFGLICRISGGGRPVDGDLDRSWDWFLQGLISKARHTYFWDKAMHLSRALIFPQ